MATPYMSLTLPTVSSTTGPGYASLLNTALTTIDSHNHSLGQGVQIVAAGLKIDADLAFNLVQSAGVNLTGVRTLKLALQTTAPALTTDIGCVYATTAGDLYYRNGSGQAVQITSGASLAAVGTGSISGLSAPATAAFSSASGAFSWRSNTNVAASMDGGPLTIRDIGVSAQGITIASPVGLAGAYQLTLPTALPGTTQFVTLSSTGVLSSVSTTLARSNLPSVGQQISSSCGAFSTASASFVNVTNLSVSITTTGRPVVVVMTSDAAAGSAQWAVASGASTATVQFLRGATVIGVWSTASTVAQTGALFTLDTPVAGTYTYKVQASATVTSTAINNMVLAVYEL